MVGSLVQACRSAAEAASFMKNHHPLMHHHSHGRWATLARGYTLGAPKKESVDTRVDDIELKVTEMDRKMDKVVAALERIEAATVTSSGAAVAN